jgi:competence protein ComEC
MVWARKPELPDTVYLAYVNIADIICNTALRTISPRYVIVSAGEGNNYGHPHEEVLERAADFGAAVLRTDELGAIDVVTDGQGMWWRAQP